MSVIHDLNCPICSHELFSVVIENQNYPDCPQCGSKMRWTPRVVATDVRGSEQVSHVLCEPDNPSAPVKYTSTRELDAKMRKQGLVPAGDRWHGSLGNSDPAKGRIYSSGMLGERKRNA